MDMGPSVPQEERKARVLVEKKTVLNLIDAFCVAVKHYLRGEEGTPRIHRPHGIWFYVILDIFYEDLYHLVKFLPTYALPAGMPSNVDLSTDSSFQQGQQQVIAQPRPSVNLRPGSSGANGARLNSESLDLPRAPRTSTSATSTKYRYGKGSSAEPDELLPARSPPQYSFFDIFPFSLLVRFLTRRGKEVKGKKGALLRARLRRQVAGHNLPLEISLYLVRFSSQ